MPDFLIELVGCFIRDPATGEERRLSVEDEFNPISSVKRATVSSWVSKNNSRPRRMGSKTAKKIYDLRDLLKFQIYFEKKATPEQAKSVMENLRKYHFSVTEDECFELSAKLFSKIIEFRSKNKNDVKPEDVESTDFIQDTDVFFLNEVANKCPLCHKPLIKKKNGKKVPQYRVVLIYPYMLDKDDLDDFDAIKKAPDNQEADENRISLCMNCANSYEREPVVDEYSRMVDIKRQALIAFNLDNNLEKITLEKDVLQIVKKIAKIDLQSTKNIELEMNPLSVNEKLPNNFMLQKGVTTWVQYYYNVINREFIKLSRLGDVDFDAICMEVKLAFIKIKKYKNTKEEQFEAMVDWIQQELGVGDELKNACRCVTSFFVQNCEVFEKNETT